MTEVFESNADGIAALSNFDSNTQSATVPKVSGLVTKYNQPTNAPRSGAELSKATPNSSGCKVSNTQSATVAKLSEKSVEDLSGLATEGCEPTNTQPTTTKIYIQHTETEIK